MTQVPQVGSNPLDPHSGDTARSPMRLQYQPDQPVATEVQKLVDELVQASPSNREDWLLAIEMQRPEIADLVKTMVKLRLTPDSQPTPIQPDQPVEQPAQYEYVEHPKHYNLHPSGVECIDIIEHMSFNLGTAVKYCWRQGLKPEQPSIQDLRKAIWYINREIELIEKQQS